MLTNNCLLSYLNPRCTASLADMSYMAIRPSVGQWSIAARASKARP
jgi:hypothetical protein